VSGQPGRSRHTAGRVVTRAGTTLVVPTLTPSPLVSLRKSETSPDRPVLNAVR
jgi:hypothetical protein